MVTVTPSVTADGAMGDSVAMNCNRSASGDARGAREMAAVSVPLPPGRPAPPPTSGNGLAAQATQRGGVIRAKNESKNCHFVIERRGALAMVCRSASDAGEIG
jgi:hypothetical protein